MDPTARRTAVIRLDAGPEVGLGHFVRGLALAAELKSRGLAIWFAGRLEPAWVRERIVGEGHRLIRLEDAGADVPAALAELVDEPIDILLVDHYAIGNAWLEAAGAIASRRVAIDDLGDRPLSCDVVVNPNLGAAATTYAALVPDGTVLLLGPRYAPLRAAFGEMRQVLRRVPGPARRVLVSLGGGHDQGASAQVVDVIGRTCPNLLVDVVLGPAASGALASSDRLHVHRSPDARQLAELMADADFAVGAGGTSAWERCCLGLPSVIVRVAANQDRSTASLVEAGAALDAGLALPFDSDRVATAIRTIAADDTLRGEMSRRAASLVDGLGAVRVANELDPIRLRPASPDDARLLWEWANDPATRASSFRSEPISWPEHVAWLERRMADPDTRLLIGQNGRGPVGQVRLERDGANVEVSISVAADHRGAMGGPILRAGVDGARRYWPGATLVAQVKPTNGRSLRMFTSAGFKVVRASDGIVVLHLKPGREENMRATR
jgi:UDP-2,4-diacetamido-2,4,6-trideoxy-beta-L-altropyranose hydrolase